MRGTERGGDSQLYLLFLKPLKTLHQIHNEPSCCSAVDYAVIIRKCYRQHQAWLEFVAAHNWLHGPTAKSQDGYLGLVYNRCEMPAADATLVGNRENPAFKLFSGNFSVACFFGQFLQLFRKLEDAFLIYLRITGTINPASVSTATPMWQ